MDTFTNNIHYERFKSVIGSLSEDELSSSGRLVERLLIAEDQKVKVAYCPFEWINSSAKIVIVGITPGPTQLVNAARAFKAAFLNGQTQEDVLKTTKKQGAFSGSLRQDLIPLLDEARINRYLKIDSCASLFGENGHLVHTTSLIRNATFKQDGTPYNGTPDPIKNSILFEQIQEGFCNEISLTIDALIVPLGAAVDKAVRALCDRGFIDSNRVLFGIPHPAGGNRERTAYFLGRKKASDCSYKTNPVEMDRKKQILLKRISVLSGDCVS
jgi:hypothetical protein